MTDEGGFSQEGTENAKNKTQKILVEGLLPSKCYSNFKCNDETLKLN